MSILHDCFASLSLVFTGETTCRLCFITAPIVWVFGSFMLAIKAITIYAKLEISTTTIYLIFFGLIMLLCGIFSASNAIHVCIQLPTSHTALKIQKYSQIIILVCLIVLILCGWVQVLLLEDIELITDLTELLWLGVIFLLLFTITTVSCIMA